MSAKPRSEWTPAYRRRVERAEAAGKSRTQARGHGATPERPERANLEKNREKYREYTDKKKNLIAEIQDLKKHWFSDTPKWNEEASLKALQKDPDTGKQRGTRELERDLAYISKWTYVPEFEEWDDEVDNSNALFYH